jgi:hypothetical protein
MFLTRVLVETFKIKADLCEVESDVLGEAQLVAGVRENGGVDHLGIAVPLGLHH